MYILKWFRFIIAKIYNILRYVIDHKLRHMCNFHIKETEISQKRSKGIKNWKITYSFISSVLSNKTNLILGGALPLTGVKSLGTRLFYIYPTILKIFIIRGFSWQRLWTSKLWFMLYHYCNFRHNTDLFYFATQYSYFNKFTQTFPAK